jgi:hypothetical protein
VVVVVLLVLELMERAVLVVEARAHLLVVVAMGQITLVQVVEQPETLRQLEEMVVLEW